MGSAYTESRDSLRTYHISLLRKYFPDAESIVCIGARHYSEPFSFVDVGYKTTTVDRLKMKGHKRRSSCPKPSCQECKKMAE